MSTESSRHEVTVELNGARRTATCEARTTLADFLREHLRATGTHVACEHGVCGACTVLLDGEAVRSCLLFAVQADGRRVETIEGLGTPQHLHPVQQAFLDAMSFQCGFCTPGIVMTTIAFLRERRAARVTGSEPGRDDPTDEEPTDDDLTDEQIRELLSANLCRCTGYQSIVAGVRAAAAVDPD
jgi:carbon-monoxide dehydrogenase small subunit